MDADLPRVPVRTKALLEEWVTEFLSQGLIDPSQIVVAVQDGSDGRDTGLVMIHLQNAPADIYMQPVGVDQTRWEATLTARSDDLTITPYQLTGLGAEVTMAASLCGYLQFKSLEWDRMTGLRTD